MIAYLTFKELILKNSNLVLTTPTKVLITGGLGFVGSELCRILLKQNVKLFLVRVLSLNKITLSRINRQGGAMKDMVTTAKIIF